MGHETLSFMMETARELSSRLADLLRREHLALADFLVALADFDQRRCWAALGYSGLFDYLHRHLGLSRATAFYRKTAADLLRRFPEIVEPLKDERLCITSVVELAKVITPENRGAVLPRFFHRSKREAMAVAAEICPKETVPLRAVVTEVKPPSGTLAPAPTAQPPPVADSRSAAVQPVELPAQPVVPPPSARPRPESIPLTADMRRLHVTVSKGFLAKVESARSALSHSRPGASLEDVLEVGLDLILARETKKRALVAKPRPAPPIPTAPANPRHIPAHVRRAVWDRDGGRCSWPLDSGGVCGSTLRLQLDHVVPVALGGVSAVDNLRVTCAFHNDLAARQAFGDAHMDLFRRCAGNGSGDAVSVVIAVPDD
jgi:hypothetical protein